MFRFASRIAFLLGFLIGVYLAVLYKSNETQVQKTKIISRPFTLKSYEKHLNEANIKHKHIPWDTLRYSDKKYIIESSYLSSQIKVLCIILVKTQKNFDAAKATWGKGCTTIHQVNLTQKTQKIVIKRKREDSSWILLCKTLHKVDTDKYNWILIIYDYTFVILENLRLFLANLDSNEPYYLGNAVEYWGTVYNMGQAGYVISRGALNKFQSIYNKADFCTNTLTYMNKEDYYLGKHMAALNITPLDTRDSHGYTTFYPYNLYQAIFPSEGYYKYSIYPQKCCGSNTVAFQSIEADKMYTYYYLIYTLQVFYEVGIFGNKPRFDVSSNNRTWIEFLKERDVPLNITARQYYKIWEDLIGDPSSFASAMKREEYEDYDALT